MYVVTNTCYNFQGAAKHFLRQFGRLYSVHNFATARNQCQSLCIEHLQFHFHPEGEMLFVLFKC